MTPWSLIVSRTYRGLTALSTLLSALQLVVSVQARSNFLGGQQIFIAAALSLEDLLQYTEENKAETGVEVALTAELFRDRLDLHYGLGLLRCLACLEAMVRSDFVTVTPGYIYCRRPIGQISLLLCHLRPLPLLYETYLANGHAVMCAFQKSSNKAAVLIVLSQ